MANDLRVYEILSQIQKGESFHDVMTHLGDPEFDTAIEYIYSHRYVTGFLPMRVASGRLTVDASRNDFGITPSGKEFIDSYTLHNRR
ncbi:hypothetical protein J2T12_005117 [Paenibacillus anaericanus]|uniref:hypothetical protein n=1 Tax=Paenibacillus anaericanus TaxID=170367 RepID=UPI00277F8A90|nr:hypothetical protein [Paenibacillus anaericanus]MDQ0091677.1 hypothetical protein [Paenibacillus anaericanus]